ncbi:MAG: hypothetical protein H0X71_03310 [Rubrobacter sp.]|nr:hypothetical protein [Rubrobacter sp.]
MTKRSTGFRIRRLLGNHVKVNNPGRVYAAETGFEISSPRMPRSGRPGKRLPDRRARPRGRGSLPANDIHAEVMEKVLAGLEAGSHMVLVVDPGEAWRTVTVYSSREDIRILTAKAGGRLDSANVVPGWTAPITNLFTEREGRDAMPRPSPEACFVFV